MRSYGNDKEHFWQDDYGDWSLGAILFVVFAGIIAFILTICVIVWQGSKAGCNAKGDAYGLESNYNFWANTCFVKLPDGRTANIDNVRENTRGYTIYVDPAPSEGQTPVPVPAPAP